jgi:hypothetical protein
VFAEAGVDRRLQRDAPADDGHDQDGESPVHGVIFADPACHGGVDAILICISGGSV